MIWANILKKLKTIWTKGKYYIVTGFATVLAFAIIFLLKKKGDPWKVFDETQDRHDKELGVINKNHQKSVEEHNQELETYHKAIESIEKTNKQENKKLNSKYKKEVKKIVKKYKNKPDDLSKKLFEEFGIKHEPQ
jgi:uncharacterized protein YlxW (UPF0749 family)